MNVHDRIIKSLEHEEPDRVPTLAQIFEYPFTQKVFQNIMLSTKSKTLSTLHQMLQAAIHLGFDSIWYHYEQIKTDKRERPAIPEEIKKEYGIYFCDDWARYLKNGWYQDGVLKTPELLKEWTSYINTWEPAAEVYFRRFKNYCL